MKVKSILDRKGHQVTTIQPWASVASAVRQLVGPPTIGALVVTGVPTGFTGLITERDVVRAINTHGLAVLDKQVGDIMPHHVPTCTPDDTVARVIVDMTTTRYRHLPVVENGELAGLISIGDVVRHRLEEIQLETNVLRDLYHARH